MKLTRILRSKEVSDITLVPDDLVEVFSTSTTTKRGKWSLIEMDRDVERASWTVSVPASFGHTIPAAIEYVPHELAPESLASLIRQVHDALDIELE